MSVTEQRPGPRHRLAQAVAGGGLAVIPRIVPTERLEKLRRSIQGAWESALVFGGGNYLEQVYIPQYLGLVDVASAAEQLYLEPQSAEARHRLRRELDDFLRDLETAKLQRGIYGRAADERFQKVRRLERVVALVREVVARGHDCEDSRARADYETATALLLGALEETRVAAEGVA